MLKIFRRIKSLFRYILVYSDYETFEFFGSCILILSALVILNPYADIYSNGVTYTFISRFIDEDVLGVLVLFLGLNSVIALFQGDLYYRRIVNIAQVIFWGIVFVTFLTVNPTVWFPWFTGIFSLFSLATAARIHRDIKQNIPSWTDKQ